MKVLKYISGATFLFLILMLSVVAAYVEKWVDPQKAALIGIVYASILFASGILFGIITVIQSDKS